MKLKNLLLDLEVVKISGDVDVEIRHLTDDSRKVKPGSLFVAIKGDNFDGHSEIPRMQSKGAVAIIGEQKLSKSCHGVAYIQVANSRKDLGKVAANWYKRPVDKIKLIGVTGTDGKTTTVLMINHILNKSGYKSGYISTVGYDLGKTDKKELGVHVTTPSSLEIQRLIRKAVDNNLEYLIIEASSHGLKQHRLSGCEFDVSVLTNVTCEHLDYHGNYEDYLFSKAMLFNISKKRVANIDDQSFKYLRSRFANLISYGSSKIADFSLDKYTSNLDFKEKYNQYNALAAMAVCSQLGIEKGQMKTALLNYKFPPGRQEVIQSVPFKVIVDFAHTPNGLRSFMEEFRRPKGKLIHVFGSAGERDQDKRPKMGRISARYSDIIILTAEDPRSESVRKINSQIKTGIIQEKREIKLYEIEDRAEAIYEAIKLAQQDDLVIITGKGPEKSMNINGIEYKWSDKEVVKKALKNE